MLNKRPLVLSTLDRSDQTRCPRGQLDQDTQDIFIDLTQDMGASTPKKLRWTSWPKSSTRAKQTALSRPCPAPSQATQPRRCGPARTFKAAARMRKIDDMEQKQKPSRGLAGHATSSPTPVHWTCTTRRQPFASSLSDPERTSYSPSSTPSIPIDCKCGRIFDDPRGTIHCASPTCKIGTWHKGCGGKGIERLSKHHSPTRWLCPDCRAVRQAALTEFHSVE